MTAEPLPVPKTCANQKDLQNTTLVDRAPIVRLIAYYLPQFHPIPENDVWWGKGFTEWTNVAKARPLFSGHQQPRLPSDLGFYDLRVPESREAQAAMARNCGIEGFCYWHYWFGNGRRLLERPFQEVLRSKKPNFPFCLSWANQTWSGIWHGNPKHTLIEQVYPGREDETAHFEYLRSAFEDERYIKVDGRPLFSVYMPLDLPDTAGFIERWRNLAVRAGFRDLFLVGITNVIDDERLSSFDAITPNGPGDFINMPRPEATRSGIQRISRMALLSNLKRRIKPGPRRFKYADLVTHGLNESRFTSKFLPCVVPNWDNTPRSGYRGVVIEGSTPQIFGSYLKAVCEVVSGTSRRHSETIVFLKAWNEWAEGNYVEPDNYFGDGYLKAIRGVLFQEQPLFTDQDSQSRQVALFGAA